MFIDSIDSAPYYVESKINFKTSNTAVKASQKPDDNDVFTSQKDNNPVFAIADDFSTPETYLDIDGDNVRDLSHGSSTCYFVNSFIPSAKLALFKYEVGSNGLLSDGLQYTIKVFNEILYRIKNGEKFDAVIFPAGTTGITISKLAEFTNLALTRENLGDYSKSLLKKSLSRKPDFALLPKALSAIEAVAKETPVYISAGNGGSEEINLYSLAEGVISVGATNANGNKTHYTHDHPLVNRFERGDYNIVSIKSQDGKVIGYDITSDGILDITNNEVSGKGLFINPVLQEFIGKNIKDVLISPENIQKLKDRKAEAVANNELFRPIDVIPDIVHMLLPVEEYGAIRRLDSEFIQRLKGRGDYITFDQRFSFRIKPDGTLFYSPDGSELDGKDVIGLSWGASNSAPTAAVNEALRKNPFLKSSDWSLNPLKTKLSEKSALSPILDSSVSSDKKSEETRQFPTAIIMDIDIDKKTCQIDGVGEPDMSHGEVIQYFAKGIMPKANIILVNLNKTLSSLKDAFYKIAVDKPEFKHIDAINLSLGTDVKISISDLARETELPLTRDNLIEYKSQIKEYIFNTPDYDEVAKAIKAIELATGKGIPVYIGAGNSGWNNINMLSFANGVTIVGATNAKGEKTAYTADHSMVTCFERGDYNITQIKDTNNNVTAFDINGDNQPDIPCNKVSGKGLEINPVLIEFIGKPLQDALISDDVLSKLQNELSRGIPFSKLKKDSSYQHVLFPVELYGQLRKGDPETTQKLKHSGNYITMDGQFLFKVNAEGKIYYSPDGSEHEGAVWLLKGTSFASPGQCFKDLKEKYISILQDNLNVLNGADTVNW